MASGPRLRVASIVLLCGALVPAAACTLDTSGTQVFAEGGAGGSGGSSGSTSGPGATSTAASTSATGGTCTEGAPCETGQPGPCGPGAWSCEAAQCVATSAPSAEVCNGVDDDCNGPVDDAVAQVGTACAAAGVGACGTGVWACDAGVAVCQSTVPSAEVCNGIDDDCNGYVDDLPRASQASLSGTNIDSLSLAGGPDFVTVHPGEVFSVGFNYFIKDPCMYCGCIDQLLVGFAGGSPQVCAYDGTPGCTPGAAGTYGGTLVAPYAPGAYAIQFGFSQQYDCILDWGTSGSNASAASVCVVP